MRVSELRAMLITAGFGTRLLPLTELLPKPAVPVANRSALWFALDHLQRLGIRDVVLNTHHLPQEIERAARSALVDLGADKLQLRFVYEPAILGTGGGVRNAWRPRADETFLIVNGKLVFAPDVAGALAEHEASEAFATMIVKEVPVSDRTAVVGVDEQGGVRSLPGYKSEADTRGTPVPRFMYTGVSLLHARAHAQLPSEGCLIRDGYARWLACGERVRAFVDPGHFRDVGMSLWHYLEANLELATGRSAWPGIAPSAAGVLCAASARVAPGVSLRNCVIGADAELAAGVELERAVVWPNTRVTASCTDAILLPNGRVVPVGDVPRAA